MPPPVVHTEAPKPTPPSARPSGAAGQDGPGLFAKRLAPGVLLAAAVGTGAFFIARLTPSMSPLVWAILIGATLANAVGLPRILQPGITFSAKQVLRLAVGLLGLRLGLSELLAVGPVGLATGLVAVVGTLLFSVWVGQKLGLSKSLSTVLAAGTAICGAAAVVAIAGVIEAKDEDTAVGVGTVTLYGTVAMLLYPWLGNLLGMTPDAFGLWAGASIHEVAQVVAAAFSFDASAGTTSAVEIATVVKLGRVLMLAPVAIVLSLLFRQQKGAVLGGARVSPLPWFVGLFLAAMALRSTQLLPAPVIARLVQFDLLLLAVAMAGLGLDLRWSKVKAAGWVPLYATLGGTIFIAGTSLFFVKLFA